MPSNSKQRRLNEYYSKPSSSPVKSSPVKKSKKNKHEKGSPGLFAIQVDDSSDDSDVGGIKLAPSSQIVLEDTSEDDAPVELSPVARKKRQVANTQVVSDEGSSSSDDHIPLNLLPKKRKFVDSDNEQEEAKPNKRRVLKRGLKPTAEEENVLDDLDKDVVIEQRLRKPPKKTPYQKNLEKLKRQRQGLPELPSSSSQSSEEGSVDDIIELDSEGEEVRVKPIPGAWKGNKQPSPADAESSSDVEEFIVDDEEGTEDIVDLPQQFSMSRAQTLVASFKVFFQLLVHVACQPNRLRANYMEARLNGSDENARYFKTARAQLEKHLGFIRESQVASSIWKAEFKKDLKSYPELKILHIDPETFCDACNRSTAISTRQAHLSGTEYNEYGYEPLEDSADSSSDESSEESSSSSEDSDRSSDDNASEQGNETGEKAETITLNLGQHCARRVALFHAFAHWELSLFQVIEEKVIAVETRNREKLKKKKKKKKLVDTVDPDNILDWLEKKGIVSQQWSVIQSLMERAKTVEKRYTHEVD